MPLVSDGTQVHLSIQEHGLAKSSESWSKEYKFEDSNVSYTYRFNSSMGRNDEHEDIEVSLSNQDLQALHSLLAELDFKPNNQALEENDARSIMQIILNTTKAQTQTSWRLSGKSETVLAQQDYVGKIVPLEEQFKKVIQSK